MDCQVRRGTLLGTRATARESKFRSGVLHPVILYHLSFSASRKFGRQPKRSKTFESGSCKFLGASSGVQSEHAAAMGSGPVGTRWKWSGGALEFLAGSRQVLSSSGLAQNILDAAPEVSVEPRPGHIAKSRRKRVTLRRARVGLGALQSKQLPHSPTNLEMVWPRLAKPFVTHGPPSPPGVLVSLSLPFCSGFPGWA